MKGAMRLPERTPRFVTPPHTLAMITDYFFSHYIPPHEKRRRAALRDGLTHGGETRPRDPVPNEPVTLLFWSNARRPIDRVAVYYTTDGGEPGGTRGVASAGTVVFAEPDGALSDPVARLPLRRWRATLPGQPAGTLVRYRAEGFGHRRPRHSFRADAVDPITASDPAGRAFAYSVDTFRPPAWFADAILYHIFVDRFSAASDEPPVTEREAMTDFFGGTLRGVTERLPYLVELGVTAIWLSPIMTSPTYHGYNPSSYHEVAARYGGTVALRELIQAAHAAGLRVVLDFVANHTSDEHPMFRDALVNPASPGRRWYTVDGRRPYGYKSYYHVKNMPELNTEAPEVRTYLTDAAKFWIGDLGADGVRLDYVSGPSHAFWTVFQRSLKSAYPDALTLGEVTGTPPEVATYAGRLDGVMDFPLTKQLRQVFAQRQAPLAELLRYLDERDVERAPELARATLLDNHDMHRFYWLAEHDRDRLRLAAACLLTLDGTPIIYYGTEVGVTQRNGPYGLDAYARMPMRFGAAQDHDLLTWFQAWIALRRAHPALRGGARQPLATWLTRDDSPARRAQVGGYARVAADDGVLVLLNNDLADATLAARIPATMPGRPGQTLVNLMTGAVIREFSAQQDVVIVSVPRLSAVALGWR